MNKEILIIVDPQNSFCDPTQPMYVPGAEKDCEVIASMLHHYWDEVIVSMDMHSMHSMYHDIFWSKDKDHSVQFEGFGRVTKDNFMVEFFPDNNDYVNKISKILERSGYIDIWPVHCVTGTYSASIENRIAEQLGFWSVRASKPIHYMFKGTNPFKENYSMFTNKRQIKKINYIFNSTCTHLLDDTLTIYVCGEAASHCVKETVKDIINKYCNLPDCYFNTNVTIKLVTNATSFIHGYKHVKQNFYDLLSSMLFKYTEYDSKHNIFTDHSH